MTWLLRDIIGWLEELAPPETAAEWDNVGLLVGSPQQEVGHIAIALDARETQIQQAAEAGANLLLVHHPPIFRPLKSLRTDTAQVRRLAAALAHGLAIYAMHTNLDAAPGGVNDALAAALGLVQVEPLSHEPGVQKMKFVVFVPPQHVEPVRRALAAAGAGIIGDYSHCTFAAPGQGSFLPLEAASPFLGEKGRVNTVEEFRLEAVLPAVAARRVVESVRRVHPYEEMAYDLYPLAEQDARWGMGRIGIWEPGAAASGAAAAPSAAGPGSFDLPAAGNGRLRHLAAWVRERLGSRTLRVTGDLERPVRKVAVLGGNGGDFLAAAARHGADAFITGEAGYHKAQEAEDLGLALIEAGHYETEAVVLPALARFLKEKAEATGTPLQVTALGGGPPWQETGG